MRDEMRREGGVEGGEEGRGREGDALLGGGGK
jgi:hypothetical protein